MASMLGFPVPAGLTAHEATVALSEGTCQSDYGVARAAYGGNPANYATYAAAIRAADVAHMQRIVASADAHGILVLNTREGLRQLGVTA
jgi:hypothetical protein